MVWYKKNHKSKFDKKKCWVCSRPLRWTMWDNSKRDYKMRHYMSHFTKIKNWYLLGLKFNYGLQHGATCCKTTAQNFHEKSRPKRNANIIATKKLSQNIVIIMKTILTRRDRMLHVENLSRLPVWVFLVWEEIYSLLNKIFLIHQTKIVKVLDIGIILMRKVLWATRSSHTRRW